MQLSVMRLKQADLTGPDRSQTVHGPFAAWFLDFRSQRSAGDRELSASVTCFVYVIGSMTQYGYRTYVGWTLDLDRRLSEHNAGTGAKSTRGRHWQLVYAEKLETRVAAMSREWHLKRDRRLRRQLNPNPRSTRGRFNDN
jgi:putative endonuclease